jgi:hypothetical protein
MSFTRRQQLGTLLYDWPRFLWCLRPRLLCRGEAPWLRLRNRHEGLIIQPGGVGVKCDWEYTHNLHLCNVFPITGCWLLQRALRDWPLRLLDAPDPVTADKVCWNASRAPDGITRPQDDGTTGARDDGQGRSGDRHDPPRRTRLPHSDLSPTALRPPTSASPQVSFLIGHRGEERLPLLLLTLRSIAAQEGTTFECIVIEQDSEPRVRDRLPGWVRYLHTPPPDPGMPYCRSWAFNVAARAARGEVLIGHDNDMLVPVGYARSVVDLVASGCDVIQPKRFVFYLDESSSEATCRGGLVPDDCRCEQVIQNLEGGGSLAIRRDAYLAIGGFDEQFVGWGGEDNEFWDRCLTLAVHPYGYLPVLHLWHAPQPGKRGRDGNGAQTWELTAARRAIPADARIRELVGRSFGDSSRPWSPS